MGREGKGKQTNKNLIVPDANEDAEQLELMHCLWECKNSTVSMGNSLAASY